MVRRISAQVRGGVLSCLGNERTPKSATVKGRNFMKKSQLPILENGKLALRSVCLAHSLSTIFSCTTSIRISFLHFGQYSGNFTRTVSPYTFILVLPLHTGQCTQKDLFRLSSTILCLRDCDKLCVYATGFLIMTL